MQRSRERTFQDEGATSVKTLRQERLWHLLGQKLVQVRQNGSILGARESTWDRARAEEGAQGRAEELRVQVRPSAYSPQ